MVLVSLAIGTGRAMLRLRVNSRRGDLGSYLRNFGQRGSLSWKAQRWLASPPDHTGWEQILAARILAAEAERELEGK